MKQDKTKMDHKEPHRSKRTKICRLNRPWGEKVKDAKNELIDMVVRIADLKRGNQHLNIRQWLVFIAFELDITGVHSAYHVFSLN